MEKEAFKEKLHKKIVSEQNEPEVDEKVTTNPTQEGMEEQNVYGAQKREELVEADGLDAKEQAFMEGYEATAQSDQNSSDAQKKIIQQRLKDLNKIITKENTNGGKK